MYVHIYVYIKLCDWILEHQPKCYIMAYSVLLAQLIATLIHYPCTVALPDLADWSAFLELDFLTM